MSPTAPDDQPVAQLPNSAGIIEDPLEIPPAPPVDPESVQVDEPTVVYTDEDVVK